MEKSLESPVGCPLSRRFCAAHSGRSADISAAAGSNGRNRKGQLWSKAAEVRKRMIARFQTHGTCGANVRNFVLGPETGPSPAGLPRSLEAAPAMSA